MAENDVRREDAGPVGPELSEEEIAHLEEERRDRLAEENRPDGAEVDNTDRDFDTEAGKFTDSPDYQPGDRPYDDGAGETGAARSTSGGSAQSPDEKSDPDAG